MNAPSPKSNVVVPDTRLKFLIVLLYNIFAPCSEPPLIKFKFVNPVIKALDNLVVAESLLCNELVSISNIILLLFASDISLYRCYTLLYY